MKLVLRDYMKFIFGDGNFSEVGNEHFFLGCWTGPVYRVSPQAVGSGEGLRQSIHGGATNKMKGGRTFLIRWGI